MTDERKKQAKADFMIILEELRKFRVRYGFEIVMASSQEHENISIKASGTADWPEIELMIREDKSLDI